MSRHTRSADRSADRVPAYAQVLLIGGSAIRIAYGAGALLAPAGMVAREHAPNTHGLPDPRLLLRAFGGHQLVAGSLTLASIRSRRVARRTATLSLLIDTFDVISAMLEQRTRGRRDGTISGGYAISGAGMIAFAAARCAIGR